MRSNPQSSARLITKGIVVIVLLNFVGLFWMNSNSGPRNLQQKLSQEEPQHTDFVHSSPYKFINPDLAHKVLAKLDVFEPIPVTYLGPGVMAKEQYEKPFLGLTNDDEYCNKQRAYFTQNPEMVFDKMNFVMEHGFHALLRQTASAVGSDAMPTIGRHMPKPQQDKRLFDLSPNVNLFFTIGGVHRYKHVGKHYACLAQQYNHIPGHYSLNRKDTIAEGAIAYSQKFQDKPQCFSYDKYFPETWLLYKKESCQEFFAKFNSPEYQKLKKERGIVYIKKVAVGSHRGQGVFPLTDDQEEILRKEYKNGTLCGERPNLLIVQNYVHNPLLLNGRKFDFRMYMVVASTNPLMAFYHDGFLRVSLYGYDVNTTDKKILLTNLALNSEVYDDAKKGKLTHGMTQEELKIAQQWSFERLHENLMESNITSDPNWLDNYLRPELKKAMIHLVRMSSYSFLKKSSLYEFYGVDFMLDDNLTLWFLEANSGPAMDGYSDPMEKFIVKMLKDQFEITYNILKSRMKRVVMLVNNIIQEGQVTVDPNGEVQIENLDAWRKVFNKVSMNRFEPEFELSPTNGYKKILDENLSGADKYMGLLDPSCV